MKIFVNLLTLARLLATFILPILWKVLVDHPIALLIFVSLILLTDFFDGLLARTFKVTTLFGSIADQVADKMFGIIVLLIVARYQNIFYLCFIMEIVISIININAAFLGATTKSSFLGKVKMWFLGISILCGLIAIFGKDILMSTNVSIVNDFLKFFLSNEDVIVNSIVLITVGTEIMVAVDYAKHQLKEIHNNKKRPKYDFKENKDLKKSLFDTDYYVKHKNEPLAKGLLK